MTVGSNSLAEAVLDTMRKHLELSIGVVQVERPAPVWRIDAANRNGERWAAEHEDYYRAACMLAELMGFELEDG